MNITIKSDERSFFNQILELFSSFNPIKKLRKGERIVLAEIMYQNYILRDIDSSIRRNTVFSKETRELMCNNLKLPRSGFNNVTASLRRNGILDKDNNLIQPLHIFPEDTFTFKVEFQL